MILTVSSSTFVIRYRKAQLYDTADTAEEIMSMNNPLDMKKRVKPLKDFNKETWAIESREILKTALNAKFCQNEDLQAALVSTGDTMIGEASATDTHFGIGMSIHNPKVLDQTKWRGANIQGKTLMEIRQTLNNE